MVWLVSFWVWGLPRALGQELCICKVKYFVRAGGWDVPGLKGATLTSDTDPLTTRAGDGVEIRKLKPGQQEVEVEDLSQSYDSETVLIHTRKLRVGAIYRVAYHGKVFAYFVAGLVITSDGGVLAKPYNVYFRDIEGKGEFSQMLEGPISQERLQPPRWALQSVIPQP